MARTACSEACLAVYLHENSFSVSRALAAHVTAPMSSGRAARSRPQTSVGLIFVRVGCSVAWKFSMDTNSLEWNERPRIASFHSDRSNPAEISYDTPSIDSSKLTITQADPDVSSAGLDTNLLLLWAKPKDSSTSATRPAPFLQQQKSACPLTLAALAFLPLAPPSRDGRSRCHCHWVLPNL